MSSLIGLAYSHPWQSCAHVSLWAFRAPSKQSPQPTGRHLEDKIQFKISPKGRTKWLARSPFRCMFFTTAGSYFVHVFCLWNIPILGTRMIIWLWMGVENVLRHSHKTIQKQSIKPKGSEYDKVFWSRFQRDCFIWIVKCFRFLTANHSNSSNSH